jgi:hypothetical protein
MTASIHVTNEHLALTLQSLQTFVIDIEATLAMGYWDTQSLTPNTMMIERLTISRREIYILTNEFPMSIPQQSAGKEM